MTLDSVIALVPRIPGVLRQDVAEDRYTRPTFETLVTKNWSAY